MNPKNRKDITGQKFGRVFVIEVNNSITNEHYKNKDYRVYYNCVCECGKEFVCDGASLRRGYTKSCGCLQKEVAKEQQTIHGLSNTPEYQVWEKIVDRCYNKNNKKFRLYGGRNILMCDQWREHPDLFIEWLRNNKWCKSNQIDRINNNKGYSPENCRVVEPHINVNNRGCTTKFDNGESIAEVCRSIGIPTLEVINGKRRVSKIYNRIRMCWCYGHKLHDDFINACVKTKVCPAKYLYSH